MGKSILILLVSGALSASAAFGGISIADQSRIASISGQVPGGVPGSSFTQTDSAQNGQPFSVSLQNLVGTGTVTANALATQNSSIDLAGTGLTFGASGSAFGASSDVHSNFASDSRFSLTFVLDTPASYQFSEHVTSGSEADLGLLGADLMSDGQSLFGTLIPGLPRLDAEHEPFFQTDGVLAPGTYTLKGGAGGDGNLTSVDGAYTVNFSVSLDVPAIPLPATGWMGTLGLLVSGCVARRCRK